MKMQNYIITTNEFKIPFGKSRNWRDNFFWIKYQIKKRLIVSHGRKKFRPFFMF